MNKRGQIIENWAGFIILSSIGLIVFGIQLIIWKRMDFGISIWIKVVTLLGILIAAGLFTKYFLE